MLRMTIYCIYNIIITIQNYIRALPTTIRTDATNPILRSKPTSPQNMPNLQLRAPPIIIPIHPIHHPGTPPLTPQLETLSHRTFAGLFIQ